MDAKTILASIKKQFFESPMAPVAAAEPIAPAAAPAAPVMTKDGKSLNVDKMEVGGIVVLDGAPAPAGTYELEDGSSLVVDEGGVIVEVKPAADMAAEPIAPAVAPVVQAPAPVMQMESDFAALREDYGAFKQEYASYKTFSETRFRQADEQMAKQSQTITQLLELMQKIVDAPTADVPPGQKQQVSQFSKVELKSKSLTKYANAVQAIVEENKK